MKYYFLFDAHTSILTDVLLSEPAQLDNKKSMEWDTDVNPRTITVSSEDPDIADATTDLFEFAIPGFSEYPLNEPDTIPFVLKIDEDNPELQEAKNNQLDLVRLGRNDKLAKSDWTQFTDSPLTDADKALWQTYRQELRDITEGLTNPFIVTWPTEPS